MTARAVRFTAPRRVEIVPVDVREPEPGEVLVRTRFSGISAGTELLAYRGELDSSTAVDESLAALSGTFRYPFGFGYSCVGEVVRGTPAIRPGSLVFAFHPHQDRFVVADTDVVVLPSGADARAATLFPLVETALQLTLDAGAVVEETVALTGLGAVGLLTALLLRRAGARVIAAEPLQWRREVAVALGIDAVPPEELAARLTGATDGRGPALLVELSGSPSALADGLGLLAHEGTVLVGSWYGTKPVALPLGAAFHRRRLTIRSSQVSTVPAAQSGRWDVARRRAAARDLMAGLPLAELATTEFAFDQAAAAYAAIDRPDAGVVHVALRYP